jgi:hypothetical protein
MTTIRGGKGAERAKRERRARSGLVYGAMVSAAALAAALVSTDPVPASDEGLRFLRSGGYLYAHPDISNPDFILHWKVGPDGRKLFVARVPTSGAPANPAVARFQGVSQAFTRPAS